MAGPGQNVRVSNATSDTQALTEALIVDGTQAADPTISPDGRWVAWTTSSAGHDGQRVSDLALAPVAAAAAPVRLTDGTADIRLPRWSPDSAWLFYVADEELRRLQVTTAGAGGKAETVLTWRGELAAVVPLAGGRLVAVVAGDEQTDDDERRRAAGDDAMVWSERAERQHWRWHRLRLLDLDSGGYGRPRPRRPARGRPRPAPRRRAAGGAELGVPGVRAGRLQQSPARRPCDRRRRR